MLRYRFFTIVAVAAAVALSFVMIGCPPASTVDDGTADVAPPPTQGVNDGTTTEPSPGQGVNDNPLDSVLPPVPPNEVPDLGGISDAGAINPEPPALRQLFPGQAYRVGERPQSVTSGDLDGDGDLDLATANFGSNNISILLGNGLGAFSTPVNYGTGKQPVAIEMGDLDGDGDLDLAVMNRGFPGTVSILRNDGDGIFAAPENIDVGITPSSIAMNDLDGDGDLDLAVETIVRDDTSFLRVPVVMVLLNNGNGTFAAAEDIGDGTPSLLRVAGDLDGDGDIDLVVWRGDGEDASISVFFNNGDATFSNATAVSGAGGGFPTAAGDVDGDGDLDLVMNVNAELSDLDGDGDLDLAVLGDSVQISLNNGDGTFAAVMVFRLQPGSEGVFLRDGVAIFLNNGDGTFTGDMKYQTGQEPTSVTTGDWDGDGDMDLAVANSETDDVSILLNNGDGTFLAAGSFAAGGLAYSVGDLDGDGDPDFAVLSGALGISLNDGSGTFTTTATNTVRFFVATSVTSGDLDGDGDLDLVVTAAAIVDGANSIVSDFIGVVTIFRNNGDGTFAAAVNFVQTDGGPFSAAIGDLDGDGDQDLAVTVGGFDGFVAAILLNNGEGIFSAAGRYPVVDQPLSIDMGDLDGDGDLDLAVANSGDIRDRVSVLLNNGDATFAAAVNYGARTFPQSVVIGDFDGDGYPDLAVGDGSRSTGAVSILLNNGDGTFAPRVDFGTGVGKQIFVATGDLDGDGNLDLVVSNRRDGTRSGSVSVLLGHGDGTFAEAMNFVTGGLVGIVDFDSDGDLDLVVGGRLGVAILFNQLIQ